MIIRTRRPRPIVTKRDASGLPLLTVFRPVEDTVETPQDALRWIKLVNEDPEYDKIPAARAHVVVEVTVGLIMHHNLADLAKASGLTQKTLREACVQGWKGTYEVLWAVWRAFGYDFGTAITPLPAPAKKTSKRRKA
jgi:hypothetical protein